MLRRLLAIVAIIEELPNPDRDGRMNVSIVEWMGSTGGS